MGYTAKRKSKGKGKQPAAPAPAPAAEDVVMGEVGQTEQAAPAPVAEDAVMGETVQTEQNDAQPSTSTGESSSYFAAFKTGTQSFGSTIKTGAQKAYDVVSNHKAETLAVTIPVVAGMFSPSLYAVTDALVFGSLMAGGKALDNRYNQGRVQSQATAVSDATVDALSTAKDATFGAVKAGYETAKKVEVSKLFTGTPMFNGVFGGAKRKHAAEATETSTETAQKAAQEETAKQPAAKRRRRS